MPRRIIRKNSSKKSKSLTNGNWLMNIAMNNDERLYNYVRRNKSTLLKLKKADKMRLIKSNCGTSWAREDLRRCNMSNVNVTTLNRHIRNV